MKLTNIALCGLLLTNILSASTITPLDTPYDSNVKFKILDDLGNPVTNPKLHINTRSNYHMNGIQLADIDAGIYEVSIHHYCKEEKIYNENLTVNVHKGHHKDFHISPVVQNIPFTIDCRPAIKENTFETDHPYSNNTNIEKVIRAFPDDTVYIPEKTFVVHIVGETEAGYDFISLYKDDNNVGIIDELSLIGKYSGKLDKYITVYNPKVIVKFTSDYSITKTGVKVDITETNDNGIDDIK